MNSIMHSKDGSCYMCRLFNEIPRDSYREEHHVFNGPNRQLSEHYGLKVYLCIKHHTIGEAAVHNNAENMILLKKEGQKAFVEKYPDKDFRKIFGKNYLDEDDIEMNELGPEEMGFHLMPEFEKYIMEKFTKKE